MTMISLNQTPQLTPTSPELKTASKELAGSLMGQMVNSMLKTMEMPQESEMFMSFMADAVGEKIAASGLSDSIERSISTQLVRIQESKQINVIPPKAAVEAYAEVKGDVL